LDEDIEMILLSNVDTGTDVDIGINENRDGYKYRYIHGFLAESYIDRIALAVSLLNVAN
tara:strand:- start:947 stop:1123 length:177 start_codon:yes stop_codon:yes gene_type:complete